MTANRIRLLLVGSLLGLTVAQSQTLVIQTVANSVVHEWVGAYTHDYFAINPGTSSIPSFTASLSDYTAIRYTISAPEGMMFRATIPALSDYALINYSVSWETGTSTGGTTISTATSYSFTDLSGPSPDLLQTTFILPSGGSTLGIGNGIRWTNQNGAVLEFTSVSVEGNLSLIYGTHLPTYTYSAMASGIWVKFFTASSSAYVSDPGAQIQLVAAPSAIPEPSTYAAILGAAALGAAWLARRAGKRAQPGD